MRRAICLSFAVVLAGAPSLARADLGGCLLGPSDLNRCSISGAPATVLGAIAAPVLIAGAAVSVADELRHRTEERDAAAPPPTAKHGQPASLALVPDPPDPYRARAGSTETRKKRNRAFEFNENATNVATAVTGAMVVGAVIATIVHEAHK
ncbi:MAG: hypothetical protein ACXVDD_00865 [Polyangia bacterium]